jgi:hypothetical protein
MNPGGQPAPADTSQPGQQMQDDGSASAPDSFTEGEEGTGSTFANINPSGVNP